MQEEIDIIENYIEVVESLSEVLKEENALLSEYKMDEAKALLEPKNKAVAAYRSVVAYLIKNPTELESLNKEEKTEIKEISLSLDELLRENDLIIKTRMETSKSVMDTVVNMLKMSNASNSTSYGSHGTMSPLEKSKNSIAINETL